MAVYLAITGMFFLLFGLFALLRPQQAIAFPYSMKADSVDARNYLRSGAGGVTLACAGLFFTGAFIPRLAPTGVITAVVVLGGLLFGRLVSVAVDGMPSRFIRFAAGGEALGVEFGVFWLLQSGT